MDWTDVAVKVAFFALMGFIFWLDRDYPRRASPGHGFRRGVFLGAVALPADDATGQDADAPDGAAPGDEQVNGRG